jgi:hypothetical protein
VVTRTAKTDWLPRNDYVGQPVNATNQVVVLVATRDIMIGEELLWRYYTKVADFEEDHPQANVSSSTSAASTAASSTAASSASASSTSAASTAASSTAASSTSASSSRTRMFEL